MMKWTIPLACAFALSACGTMGSGDAGAQRGMGTTSGAGATTGSMGAGAADTTGANIPREQTGDVQQGIQGIPPAGPTQPLTSGGQGVYSTDQSDATNPTSGAGAAEGDNTGGGAGAGGAGAGGTP